MKPQPGIQIREYEPRDEVEVSALWDRVFAYPDARNQPANSIRQKMACQPELFFVATSEGRVIGTVMGGYDGHRGWIYSLAVSTECRSRGVGTALVKRVEAALTAMSCLKINLQVLEHNVGVVEFYERLGYKVEPRISMGKAIS
jgi:ribosomal protein S18 acetylase RimI-like enzyme